MTGGKARSTRGRVRAWLPVLVVLLPMGVAFSVGWVTASASVASSTESATGANNAEVVMNWWTLQTTATDVIPGSVPATASTNPSSPTVLPTANASWVLGSAKTGDHAIRLDFQEKGAPAAIEFELTVTFVNGSAGSVTDTVYVETQLPSPTGAIPFSFYLDGGTAPPGFESVYEVSQQCSAFGSCP